MDGEYGPVCADPKGLDLDFQNIDVDELDAFHENRSFQDDPDPFPEMDLDKSF
jgi:hypothetical protein